MGMWVWIVCLVVVIEFCEFGVVGCGVMCLFGV